LGEGKTCLSMPNMIPRPVDAFCDDDACICCGMNYVVLCEEIRVLS
jgi:hypothetical protein